MANKNLKIAVFHLAFIYSGGGERLVLQEAKGLRDLGHKVEIFAPVVDKSNCFPDIIKDYEIKTFLPQLPLIVPGHESFQILLTCVLAPFFVFKFRKFDVILAANQPSPWIAWWVRLLFSVPYVSYLAQPTRFLYPRKIDERTGLAFTKRAEVSMSAALMNIFKGFIKWIDGVSIRGSNVVLANGDYVKEVLQDTYKIKAVACPAGPQPPLKLGSYKLKMEGNIKVSNKTLQKPYLLITNRHFAQKRFEYGIFSLSFLLGKFPHYSLVITGSQTDYTNELKVLINRLNINDKVKFLGYVKDKDLMKLYANAACYLYTAPEEDFGMGIVEAMAHGTPVVAWGNAGPKKIIKHGITGLLAEPFGASNFSDMVLKVVLNPSLAEKIGEEAVKEVKEKFSFRKHIETLEKYLKNIHDEYQKIS